MNNETTLTITELGNIRTKLFELIRCEIVAGIWRQSLDDQINKIDAIIERMKGQPKCPYCGEIITTKPGGLHYCENLPRTTAWPYAAIAVAMLGALGVFLWRIS